MTASINKFDKNKIKMSLMIKVIQLLNITIKYGKKLRNK